MAALFDTVNAYVLRMNMLYKFFCYLEKPCLLQNKYIYSINYY
jgi:hypothetical protein